MSGGGSVLETSYDHAPLSPHRRALKKFKQACLTTQAWISGAGAAVEYLRGVGMDEVQEHGRRLNRIMTTGLRHLEEVRLLDPQDPDKRGSICSFNVKC